MVLEFAVVLNLRVAQGPQEFHTRFPITVELRGKGSVEALCTSHAL